MEEITVRFWQPQDLPDLQEIFTAAFGDPPDIAAAFHRVFLTAPEVCTLAAVPDPERPAGRPVAAAYCLPGPTLHFPDRSIPSAYLYAFGCLPAWRGQGITKKVYTSVFTALHQQGLAGCLIPATDALLQAYNRTGYSFVPLGRIRSARATGADARKAVPLPAEPLPWQEYARLREAWLQPHPHAAYPDSYYRLAEAYDYSFLALPGALAAVIPLEGRCVVAELLCPEANPARALAGIAEACPAVEYEVRTPAFFPGPGELRTFAYCHDPGERRAQATVRPALDSVLFRSPETESFWYPFGLE